MAFSFFKRSLGRAQTLKKGRMASSLPKFRNYAGAQVDRLTSDWFSSEKSVHELISAAGHTLRNRARDLERNDDFVRRFLQVMETNVVGPQGITRQARSRNPNGQLDRAANRKIEQARKEWGRPGVCTMCGTMTERRLQAMALRRFLVDGEFLARVHIGAGNGFGFAIEVIDADCLDYMCNREPAAGVNRISCGVEQNEYGRAVAYHMLSAEATTYSRKTVRIPAEQILHWFIQERPRQPRGVSWLAPTMLRKRMLDGFEQAAVVAARVSASKMGFFKPNTEAGYTGDGVDAEGWTAMSAEPGEFEQLPMGLDFQAADFAWPNVESGEFSKAIRRGLASGMGLSYHTLASDLEGVNYTSSRTGALEDRALYRVFQQELTDYVLEPTDTEWLKMAITAGALNLPMAKLDKFEPHIYRPKGWQWVDPKKEEEAVAVALANGTTSRTRVCAERGIEFEDLVEELREEKELLAEIIPEIMPPPAEDEPGNLN